MNTDNLFPLEQEEPEDAQIDWGRMFPDLNPTLSFNDLDIQELWLIGTPPVPGDVPEPSCISDSMEIFLHTFMDEEALLVVD